MNWAQIDTYHGRSGAGRAEKIVRVRAFATWRASKGLCPTLSGHGIGRPMDREPKWKSRALTIEFWVATAFVGGAFLAGLVEAIRSLLQR